MKALIRSLLLFAGLTLLISSCSKDEEGVPNRIIIDGTSYKLTNGFISGFGIYEDDNGELGTVYRIALTSQGVEPVADFFTGDGQALDLIIFSGSTYELSEGTYNYEFDFIESTLYDGIGLDGDFDLPDYAAYILTDGSITVSRSGDKWVFEFELVMTNFDTGDEVEVTGSFSGLLEEID